MKKSIQIIFGAVCGLLNGLFGSGGGVVAVPALEASGLEPKKSHATSVAVIFILSAVSTVAYGLQSRLDLAAAWEFIPWGLIGAAVGAVWLKKIPNGILRRVFGAVVTAAAVRMFF